MEELSRRGLLRAAGRTAAVAGVVATVGIATEGVASATQSDWRYCQKCSGLWFAGNSNVGECPNSGTHTLIGSGNYNLKFSVDAGAGQTLWRYCFQCNGLWFSGNGGTGDCAGSFFLGHSMSGSGNYKLEFASAPGAGQTGWRWCHKCLGLWFSLSGVHTCPSGGLHSQSGSGDYKLRQV